MFESYSSRANQSAVDKLIQLATGKKAPEAVEEERPAPESMEQPQAPVEASAVEQPVMSEAPAEVAVEVPAAAEPMAESAPSDAPVDSRSQVADLLRNLANAPEPAAEAVVEEPPVEAASEAAEPEFVAAEPPAAVEPVSAPEPVAAPEPKSVAAPEPESVVEPESVAAPEPYTEPEPAPVEERVVQAESVEAQGEPAPEPRVEEPPAAAAVEAASAPAVEEPPAAEAVSDAAAGEAKPAEAVSTEAETPAAETSAASTEKGSDAAAEAGEATEAGPEEAREQTAAASEAGQGENAASAKEPDDEPFNLEKFRQRQAERRQRRGADIFPSADETSFLRSRYRDSSRDEVTAEELKTLSRDPMWKTLIQFKGWLPVVTRVLPLLDLAGKRASSGNSDEIKDSVEGLLVSNRDMRTTLQSQTVELKRVEEEIARLREVSDKSSFEQNAISEDVRGIQRLLKNAFLYLGILLGLMVVAVGYMGFLVFRYLNHPMH